MLSRDEANRRGLGAARGIAIGVLVSIPMWVGIGVVATQAGATPPNPDHKVTLCHRTGSESNPYIVITTDIASDGYVKGGHDGHTQVGNGLGSDIIPAYEYTRKDGSVFSYPGFGLDQVFDNGETGADVLANGCVLSGPTETPPPPTTEPPVPPTIEPAASIEADCDSAVVTLDNSASTDGDDEGGTAQFGITVDGLPHGGVINVSAGETTTREFAAHRGDLIEVVDLRDGTVLAAVKVTEKCNGQDVTPPDKGGKDTPKGSNPPKDLAFTGLSGGQMALAGLAGVLFVTGMGALWWSRKRSLV